MPPAMEASQGIRLKELFNNHLEKEKIMACLVPQVDQMIARAGKAAESLEKLSQLDVDRSVAAMTRAGVANERKLAELAVEETGIGNVEDKVIKNHFGTQVVYDYMKDKRSVGIIEEDDGIISIAEPFGVIAAITPTTNPTSTTMFKSLIALKG